MIRYLLLLLHGGIYSDTDTHMLKTPQAWGGNSKLWRGGDGWLTEEQAARLDLGQSVDEVLGKPSVVVGIEADVGNREDWYDWWPRPVSSLSNTQLEEHTNSPDPNCTMDYGLRTAPPYRSICPATHPSFDLSGQSMVTRALAQHQGIDRIGEVR